MKEDERPSKALSRKDLFENYFNEDFGKQVQRNFFLGKGLQGGKQNEVTGLPFEPSRFTEK
jgi:hypothetical protein